ncbi:AMP-binding protein [Nocardia arizonensis]|uniref:AMP-binding protein n=1 Tax=Nocardia arizonensis TaxID=1141647 RepID=UPI0006D24050|nr:AMP-binding protein [Nocardia arizonensis]
MKPDKNVAAVRDWLSSPTPDTGVHLADESDGWEYRSYAEIAEQTWAIAARMRSAGFGSGDGACVIMPTGFPCVAAFYAVWACGGVFTPVAPPMFGDLAQIVAHIAGIIEQAAPRLVVTSPEFESFVGEAAKQAGRADEVLVIDAATLPRAPETREFGAPDECALLQFTSGSTGNPRGVRVSWRNLANNIAMISALIDWRAGEAMVSWLPLYHDMGLVGAFLTTVTNQGELYLMRPDQFVRDPARWLRAMAHAQHTPSPSFALGYVAHRVRPEEIADLDLSGWRTLAVGSEPVEVADLQSFADLTAPRGFSRSAYTLAYGLAEATLMVTSSARARPVTALRIDNPNLRFGQPVPVLAEAILDDAHRVSGGGWITGLGCSTTESRVHVIDEDGVALPDGTLGELVVTGDSVAMGYSGEPATGSSTRIVDGALYSGDAGFLYRGEVFVLGRMGSSLKVRGRSVFMEDIESRVAQETGLTKGKLAAVALTAAGAQGIALFAEAAPGDWIPQARKVIRGELGPAQTIEIVTGPRGIIRRTSSGKPRRRHMWQLYRDGALEGATAHGVETTEATESRSALPLPRVRELLDKALRGVELPADAAVVFEGSLAEGFGNEGSDVDFLAVVPGDEQLPTLPTVLFVDGRRVEVRTRSVAQLRGQLEQVAGEPDEDLLNRCQRFLRATVLRHGAVDVDALRAVVSHDELAAILDRWWTARAVRALRYAVALKAFGAVAEAAEWARDGITQAVKAWAARRGETYVETKWLPNQLDRIGEHALIERYRELADSAARTPGRPVGDESFTGVLGDGPARAQAEQAVWSQVWELAADLGVPDVEDDPRRIVFARRDKVTTWPIGGRVHVLREDRDVFVLSDTAAAAWRSVVFRHSVRDVTARQPGIGGYLAEFVALGFVGLQWRGGPVIEPALAMCKSARPYTPAPAAVAPVLGLSGAARGEAEVCLAPLPADRFTECALNLVWSNVVLENAREDLAGAVKDGQGAVADIAAHRLVAMAVRVLLSAFGVHPLPADVAPAETVARLLPSRLRDELLPALDSARGVRFSALLAAGGDALAGLATLDDFVVRVRGIAAGAESTRGFPASFDSREQWQRTLAIGYDWLRLAGYLNSELPLDEARDLLASGGRQPHLRDEEAI